MSYEVFIDTGFWFAYLVRQDNHHQNSVKLMEELMSEGSLLSTSELVISETYTLLMREVGAAAALKFMELLQLQIEEGFTKIYWINWPVMEESRRILQKYIDHQLSFADAASAALVIKYGIPAIATYDHHFQMMRLPCLP
ncbi:MAG: type II toxin-antitoxin system VapC family toxin [Bacteroidota bacterium]